MLKDYQCELQIILLALKTCCSSLQGEATSSLVQFVADLFLSTLQDHHNLEVRVEMILAARSDRDAEISSELSTLSECSLSLEEIIAASVVIPDVSTVTDVNAHIKHQ